MPQQTFGPGGKPFGPGGGPFGPTPSAGIPVSATQLNACLAQVPSLSATLSQTALSGER